MQDKISVGVGAHGSQPRGSAWDPLKEVVSGEGRLGRERPWAPGATVGEGNMEDSWASGLGRPIELSPMLQRAPGAGQTFRCAGLACGGCGNRKHSPGPTAWAKVGTTDLQGQDWEQTGSQAAGQRARLAEAPKGIKGCSRLAAGPTHLRACVCVHMCGSPHQGSNRLSRPSMKAKFSGWLRGNQAAKMAL